MMSKDSVRKRIEGEAGISFTEFTYQLIQGYDFYWLYQNKNCRLQMGGSDQWGNITTGAELVRRKAGGEAFAFTCPLLTKTDGSKFGKSEGGNIWLDKEKTSPYQFYQFWLNAGDADAESWIKIFTFLSKEEISELIVQHKKDAGSRTLQKRLAQELTLFVHGEEEYTNALLTTQKLFDQQNASARTLSIEDLENMQGIVKIQYALSSLQTGIDVISLVTDTDIFPSKGEARKMIQNGGLSINREKVADVQMQVGIANLLHQKYLLVQRGKKNYYLIMAAE
jgi:tyrosyl-tRNA synthetase